MGSSHPVLVLLAEDHQMVREGLRVLLDGHDDVDVVGEAADGEAAVRLATERGPDVVVMDLGLPLLNGVEATVRLRKERPDILVVALSMHDDAPTVDRALRAGARGYVLKGAGVDCLAEAVRTVVRGDVYLSPGVSDYVLQGYLAADEGAPDPLTPREREVLQLVAEGHTGRQAAARLGLSPRTVENHRARIMDKLGIHTTAGLVRYAMRIGLVQ